MCALDCGDLVACLADDYLIRLLPWPTLTVGSIPHAELAATLQGREDIDQSP